MNTVTSKCHRTENARKRICEIVQSFPKPASNDTLLMNTIRDVAIKLFSNCMVLWTKNHAKNSTQDKKAKFVMPKSRDITVASCLICAVYSTNQLNFYPFFPLDAIRYSFTTTATSEAIKIIEFEKFKKRVFEFVSTIQENELIEINHLDMSHVPTFDYGLLIVRIAQHVILLDKQESTIMIDLFEGLTKDVILDGKSPLFLCLLVLYHIGCSYDCTCNDKIELNYKQQSMFRTIITQQLQNMRLSFATLSETNEKLKSKHIYMRT